MCTRPLQAFVNPDGGRPVFGYEGVRQSLKEMTLPCGKCPECCKDYYTQWATRGSRELMSWSSSLFITLTYDDLHLPSDRSLNKKHVQDFIKRVKFHFGSTADNPIRQSYCGEYGTVTKRPHYHVILYNCNFPDRQFFRKSDAGHDVFISEVLSELWPFGFSEFGVATPATIAYLYKYILKKKSRKEKLLPYSIEVGGVTYDVAHEFIESSRNPGIGACMRDFDSLANGFISVDGKRKKLPKYYLEYLRKHKPDVYDRIQNLKFDFMSRTPKESRERLRQKEIFHNSLTDRKRKL